VVGRAIRDKYEMALQGAIDFSKCAHGQVKVFGARLFDGINLALTDVPNDGVVTDDDLRTGFAIYSVTVMCAEALKLGTFLGNLLLSQTPRTIIQATVNPVQLERMEDTNRHLLGQFYQELNKMFNFQYGRILVALSSPSELEVMLAQDLPYLTPYRRQITECVRGGSCQGVTDLLESIGRHFP
jgi:hypothetical protein